jgi:hypothetical protein
MAADLDLNSLRDNVHEAQRKGQDKPSDPRKTIVVDANAGIRTGDSVGSGERDRVSEVQTDTYAASRLAQDRETVRRKLPRNTREMKTREGVTGWHYSFDCELGRRFEMFVYFDGDYYQVKVIEPQLESHWRSPHTGHLYANGNICFGKGFSNGRPTLEAAYAKSVLWATGISIALKTGKFPFNHDQ